MSDTMEGQIKEVVDRCRRMETRLTKFLEHQGFDTKVRRPTWHNGTISIPSLATSVTDCLNIVPRDWNPDEEVDVYHQSDLVFSFFLPPTKK